MSNLCRKLESYQCGQGLPIVGSCHVNLVLLCCDGGQVPQRYLVSKFMFSIECLGLSPQVQAQGASLFWLSQTSKHFNYVKRSTRSIMSSIICFDLSPQVHTQGAGPFWLQFLSTDGEGVIHSPACFSMKTTSCAGAIRAKLICVVRACTRVIYSRAGFGQRLLAWLSSEPACTNSFCPNWSRLPQEGCL